METKDKPKFYHDNKDRVFVRAIQGEYNLKDELKRLRSLPRVRKGKEIKFQDGPQTYSKHFIEPKDGMGQTLHIHLEEYSPGGQSQKHGHVNEAVFYILDGQGAEEHDGIRYEWEAGDVAIVHNNCVHQHFNRSPDKPARALVLKTKPMYLFMNMLFQKTLAGRKDQPTPGGAGFLPREDPADGFEHDLYADHDHDHDHAQHEHSHSHSHSHSH
jgi:quercetin dioxygenase-like cupin family protein